MGILAECERTIQEAIDGLGGLDVIVSNAVSRADQCALRPAQHVHASLFWLSVFASLITG